MASRSVSPGGALLRASRVFSIPQPLPRPSADASQIANFNSDTATLPHPTHLSITTPQTSLMRGDWGFKRPLPLRATLKTSTPFIRVDSIDTFEHITEFGSSADHAMTLRKWQELNVAITAPPSVRAKSHFADTRIGKSVFEDDIDSTTHVERDGQRIDDVRWKFKGPWLAGQSNGQFNEYLHKEIRNRKGEFFNFLREPCAARVTIAAVKEAKESAGDGHVVHTNPEDVTEAQLKDFVKSLRKDRSELYKQIRNFLDLPPAPTNTPSAEVLRTWMMKSPESGTEFEKPQDSAPPSSSPYAQGGPPKTHPSAGLSYLRTSSTLYNHPGFGPQASRPPIPSRVVMPKEASTGSFQPVIGVAGFVTEPPQGTSFKPPGVTRKSSPQQGIAGIGVIDMDKVGGGKTYVKPLSATVNAEGKVILSVAVAEDAAIAVKNGTTDTLPQARPLRPSYVNHIVDPKRGSGVASSRSIGSYGL